MTIGNLSEGCYTWLKPRAVTVVIFLALIGLGAYANHLRRELKSLETSLVEYISSQGDDRAREAREALDKSKIGEYGYLTVENLTVQNVTLEDEKGKTRGSFRADEDGGSLTLRSAQGEARIYVQFSAGKPSITFTDEGGKSRLSVGATQTVTVKTGEEHTSAVSAITFFDKSGHVTRQLQ